MGDLQNESYEDPFIRNIVEFVAHDDFQTKFENFFLKHAQKFSDAEEHKFLYYDLYQKFQEMFDGELQGFCRDQGVTKEEFYKRCKEASEADPKAMHYIQILVSSAEYETFVRLMKIMKPIAQSRMAVTKAEEKDGPASPSSAKKSSKGEDDEEDDIEMDNFGADEKGSGRNIRPAAARKGEEDDDDFDDKASKK